MQSTGLEGYALFFVIMLVFLVLGCVMDSMAIILIFVPLFAPIVVAQGFDLVWFGIIVIVVTEIALITPPVGMNVFVLKAVLPDVPVLRIFKGLIPFIAVDVIPLALLVAFPAPYFYRRSSIRTRNDRRCPRLRSRDHVIILDGKTVWTIPVDFTLPENLVAGDNIPFERQGAGENGVGKILSVIRSEN